MALRVNELIFLNYYQRRGNAPIYLAPVCSLPRELITRGIILWWQSFAVSFQSARAYPSSIYNFPWSAVATRSGECTDRVSFCFSPDGLKINKAKTTPALRLVRPKLQANYQKFYGRLALDPRTFKLMAATALINFPAPRVVHWHADIARGYEIQYFGLHHALRLPFSAGLGTRRRCRSDF